MLSRARRLEGFVESRIEKHVEDKESRRLYAELDNAVVGVAASELDGKGPLPDFLTVYLSGTDLYAHVADEGPERARRSYLKVVDPHVAEHPHPQYIATARLHDLARERAGEAALTSRANGDAGAERRNAREPRGLRAFLATRSTRSASRRAR